MPPECLAVEPRGVLVIVETSGVERAIRQGEIIDLFGVRSQKLELQGIAGRQAYPAIDAAK